MNRKSKEQVVKAEVGTMEIDITSIDITENSSGSISGVFSIEDITMFTVEEDS